MVAAVAFPTDSWVYGMRGGRRATSHMANEVGHPSITPLAWGSNAADIVHCQAQAFTSRRSEIKDERQQG